MDIFVWSTVILGIWGAVGPLVGVRWGQDLAKRWQKEHWASDNVKEECRELLATMADTFSVYVSYYGSASNPFPIVRDAADIQKVETARNTSLEIFYSRLFVSDELVEAKIRDRWIGALSDYSHDRNADKFANTFGLLMREVRGIAEKVIK